MIAASGVVRPRVLVVEDSESIRVAVTAAMGAAGYEVLARADGTQVEDDLTSFAPDAVVLDLMLPGRDGFALLPLLRGTVAVMVLTARDAVTDRVRGLRGGADDYLVKPFALAELVARMEALLRRCGRGGEALEVGDVTVDAAGGRVTRAGRDIALTATEMRLLVHLVRHRGQVLSKTQLLGAVWGWEDYDLNVVEVHISALRRKLGEPRVVHTLRGLGYVARAERTADTP